MKVLIFRSLAIILSLCSFMVGALAMDLKPYAGPNATLELTELKQRLALWRSITVEAYQAKGNKDPRWDAKLVRILEAAVMDHVNPAKLLSKDELRTSAWELNEVDGCADPLADWAYFQLAKGGDWEKERLARISALTVFRKERTKQPGGKSRYASLLEVDPLSHGLAGWGRGETPEAREAGLRVAKRLADAMAAVIRDNECATSPTALIHMCDEIELNHQDFGEIVVAAVDKALADAHTEPWLANTAMAAMKINHAWAWRGSGVANSVTPEGWEGFRRNLAEADRLLVKAYGLHPKEPLIGALGIVVASVGEAPSTSADEWFRRSITACFDKMEAYNYMRKFQRPRWGGSFEAMLALGCDCVDTERFDTAVPWNLMASIFDVIEEGYDRELTPSMKQALKNTRVEAAVHKCLDKYIAISPEKTSYYTCMRAAYLWQVGKVNEAREELAKVKEQSLDLNIPKLMHVSYEEILKKKPTIKIP
jgi:hypothetical protein